MKKPIEIYPAKIKDTIGIFLVQRTVWLATYPNKEFGVTRNWIKAHFSDKKKRVARWRKGVRESKDSCVWVAKEGKRVVGFCEALKMKKHRIGTIYILPKYQHRGIGQALMTQALNWFGKQRNIYVGVAPYNTKAINFYKKFGFKIKGPVETGQLPEIEMVRKARP